MVTKVFDCLLLLGSSCKSDADDGSLWTWSEQLLQRLESEGKEDPSFHATLVSDIWERVVKAFQAKSLLQRLSSEKESPSLDDTGGGGSGSRNRFESLYAARTGPPDEETAKLYSQDLISLNWPKLFPLLTGIIEGKSSINNSNNSSNSNNSNNNSSLVLTSSVKSLFRILIHVVKVCCESQACFCIYGRLLGFCCQPSGSTTTTTTTTASSSADDAAAVSISCLLLFLEWIRNSTCNPDSLRLWPVLTFHHIIWVLVKGNRDKMQMFPELYSQSHNFLMDVYSTSSSRPSSSASSAAGQKYESCCNVPSFYFNPNLPASLLATFPVKSIFQVWLGFDLKILPLIVKGNKGRISDPSEDDQHLLYKALKREDPVFANCCRNVCNANSHQRASPGTGNVSIAKGKLYTRGPNNE